MSNIIKGILPVTVLSAVNFFRQYSNATWLWAQGKRRRGFFCHPPV
jgi:hypothetical protein